MRPPEGTGDDAIVYVLTPRDSKGENWEKQVLDAKGLGSEDVICADLDGDAGSTLSELAQHKECKDNWNRGKSR